MTVSHECDCFIEIDLLVPSPLQWSSIVKPFAISLLNRIDLLQNQKMITPNICGRCISLSDCSVACPALERIACNLVELLQYQKEKGKLCLITKARNDLLGIDPDAEPDATNNVNQLSIGDINFHLRSKYLENIYQNKLKAKEEQEMRLKNESTLSKLSKKLFKWSVNMLGAMFFLFFLWKQLPVSFKDRFEL
jgi:hypothetical protein